tara:strand:+ start:528 stop:875 length:348 start_codon:yes stop_codon:yes gene_type:complete
MSANNKQIGGNHYKHDSGEEHWDRVNRLGLSYFQACATKYIERAYLKGKPVEDLQKASHFIQKLIEIEQEKLGEPTSAYVNQDPDLKPGDAQLNLFAEERRLIKQAEEKMEAKYK